MTACVLHALYTFAYDLQYIYPIILYSNPHPADLASLHRDGGWGGGALIAEIHCKKTFILHIYIVFKSGTHSSLTESFYGLLLCSLTETLENFNKKFFNRGS